MGIKWELVDCQDGVNMYSDQKLKPGVYDKDMGKEPTISRKEAEKLLREQNELTKKVISSSGGTSLCDMMSQVCTLMLLISNSQQIKSYAVILEEKTRIKAGEILESQHAQICLIGMIVFLQVVSFAQKKSAQASLSQSVLPTLPSSRNTFYAPLQVKAQLFLLCTPDEVLKLLLNQSSRTAWDFGVEHMQVDFARSVLSLKYVNNYQEEISFKYMISENKFYILESV